MVSEMGGGARLEHHEALVVGAGLSGIAAAIALRREGGRDVVVLEKAGAMGGTWRDNTYPGCACDVPSALYSYSFAPNPEWTRAFAGQAEIREYLERVAADHGIRPLVRLGVELERAQWSAEERRWRLETSAGPMTARIVIAASGPWHEPRIPRLPGLAAFPGEAFHSARWNHEYDLTGRRVAVIGSGASAVQFVPKIASGVARLHLFQRTAQWVLPKPDHFVPPAERWVMRTFPTAQRALRAAEYAAYEALGLGFRHPWLLEQLQRLGHRHLRRTVRDPALRAKLTPQYTLGCKRILMSNSYYRSLTAPNVAVHATGVREVRGRAVIGDDGSAAEVDAIVFGTGFRILDMPIAERTFDAQGRSLAALWAGTPRAYLGTTVSGYPNFFLLLGPSLGTGHSSAFSILEAQLAYVMQAVGALRRGERAVLDVKPEALAAYVAEVQAALPRTVYNAGGCSSYYLDENGINSFSWPWSTTAMKRRLARFDVGAYRSEPAGAGVTALRPHAREATGGAS
jgi:cation diffusion facilitator CzcD-associated flavoprotein CzcO